jgi:nucleoid DNA-binding protein
MTKQEMITKVSEDLTKRLGRRVSKGDTKNIVDGVLEVLAGELTSVDGFSLDKKSQKPRKVVTIAGFGHFTISSRDYKVFPGPIGSRKTAEGAMAVPFVIKNRFSVSFRPAKALKTALLEIKEVNTTPPVTESTPQ